MAKKKTKCCHKIDKKGKACKSCPLTDLIKAGKKKDKTKKEKKKKDKKKEKKKNKKEKKKGK